MSRHRIKERVGGIVFSIIAWPVGFINSIIIRIYGTAKGWDRKTIKTYTSHKVFKFENSLLDKLGWFLD